MLTPVFGCSFQHVNSGTEPVGEKFKVSRPILGNLMS